jgi:hypothetical protein
MSRVERKLVEQIIRDYGAKMFDTICQYGWAIYPLNMPGGARCLFTHVTLSAAIDIPSQSW